MTNNSPPRCEPERLIFFLFFISFMMDDIKALRARKTFRADCGTAPLRMTCYCQRQQTKSSPSHPRSFSPRSSGLPGAAPPAPTLRLLSQREHQHWGIFPVPSRATEQHVVWEQPCLSFQLLPVLGDLRGDIRPIFDPGELLPLKKDT